MAATHLSIDRTKPDAQELMSILTQLKSVTQNLPALIRSFTTMVDGDGTQDSQYDVLATKLGTGTTAVAHSVYNELQSINFKLSTNDSQDHVADAISQVIAKIGN